MYALLLVQLVSLIKQLLKAFFCTGKPKHQIIQRLVLAFCQSLINTGQFLNGVFSESVGIIGNVPERRICHFSRFFLIFIKRFHQRRRESHNIAHVRICGHLGGFVRAVCVGNYSLCSISIQFFDAVRELLMLRVTCIGRFANVCNYPGELLYSGDNRATGKVGFQDVGK